MTKLIDSSGINIRPIKRTDAAEVGMMAKEFADYLRDLGDNTNFQFNAKSFLRDGFGHNRAFYGLIAEVDGRVAGFLCTMMDMIPIKGSASFISPTSMCALNTGVLGWGES